MSRNSKSRVSRKQSEIRAWGQLLDLPNTTQALQSTSARADSADDYNKRNQHSSTDTATADEAIPVFTRLGRHTGDAVSTPGHQDSPWRSNTDSTSNKNRPLSDGDVDGREEITGAWATVVPKQLAVQREQSGESHSSNSSGGDVPPTLLVFSSPKRQTSRRQRRRSCRSVRGFLFGTAPTGALWVRNSNCFLRYIDATLRGIGQVYLANNPISGLLFLAAVTAGEPVLGGACLIGALMSTATAIWAGLDSGATASGLFGYNGCLTGIAIVLFHWPADGPTLWFQALVTIPVLLMSALSTLLTAAVGSALVTNFNLVPLTFPFQVVTWTWILVAQSSSHLPLGPRTLSPVLPQVFLFDTTNSNSCQDRHARIPFIAQECLGHTR